MPTLEELQGGFSLGEWEVLPARGILCRDGEEVRPEPKVFGVLLALAQRNGDLVTNDELINEVWDGRAFGDEPILRCISLLRKHFRDTRPYEYIENLPRRGYRLCKTVELHAAREAQNEPGVQEGRSLARWRFVALAVITAMVAVAIYVATRDSVPPPTPKSIAILPIRSLSENPANLYIADGIQSSLGQRLIELPDFTIRIVRVPQEGDWPDVANALRVENLISGSVMVESGMLRVDYQVIDGDGVVLIAGDESGPREDLFAIQERLVRAIYDALAGSQAPALISLVAPNSAAYDSYRRGVYALEHRFEGTNLEEAIRLFKASIDIDETYGPAYLGLATAYALLPDYRDEAWEDSLELALRTVDEGVSNDRSIAEPAGAIYGFVHYQRKEWAEAQQHYQRAIDAKVVDSNAFSWYSQMLAGVGRLDDARETALRGLEIYPDSTVLNSRIAMVYTWLNNNAMAHRYFARANDLHATGIIHNMAYVLLLTRGGQFELARQLTFASASAQGASTDWIDPVFGALEDPSRAAEGLAAINAAWEDGQVIPHIVILARTLLGDVDGAMEIAGLLDQPGETFSMEILYIDELAPLRQHEDFLPLLDKLGITAHWAANGCEWITDDLVCDR